MVSKPPQGDKDMPGMEGLSRAYQSGPQTEPPPSIDARILAEARRASTATAPRPMRKTFNLWVAPASFAAVVVLSVTVVLLMSHEGVDPLQPAVNKVSRMAAAPALEKKVEIKQENSIPPVSPGFTADEASGSAVLQPGNVTPQSDRGHPQAFSADVPGGKVDQRPAENIIPQAKKSGSYGAAAPASRQLRGMASEKSRPAAVMAPQGLAAPQLSSAGQGIPADVAKFKERRDLCDHFRGEEPYDAERRKFLEENMNKYCAGTDRELALLKQKYRGHAAVSRILGVYEVRIEGSERHQ